MSSEETAETVDYYEVLGVARTASADEIKRAYRARARELHPDVSTDPEAGDKFTQLAEAYGVLSRSTTRLLYDHFGYRGRGNGWFSPGGAEAAARFLDLLNFKRRRRPVAEVTVDAWEADRGVRRRIRVTRTQVCETCDGDGAAPGSHVMVCPACGGSGRLREEGTLGEARLLQVERCDQCGGKGRLISEPCPACAGEGETTETRLVDVAVPAGVTDGQRLSFDGDLPGEVVVRVVADPDDHRFVRYVAMVALLAAIVFLLVLLAGR